MIDTALEPAATQQQQMIETASTRQSAEVQAAMVIAKKFPRDHNRSFANIMSACKRRMLAEQAVYEYPRGDQQVTGPSIRLAEALAQNWGNVDFGIVEMAQGGGESVVMAYCWDLETNTRQVKVFTVPHERHTKKGSYKLTDPRDIYETVANQGARRLRACILGIIPGDVVDAAVAECDKTLQGKNQTPIGDRVRNMVSMFSDIGVTVPMIELKLGHNLEAVTERELAKLGRQFNSIRDGVAKVEDFFDRSAAVPKPGASLDQAAENASTPRSEAGNSDAPATPPKGDERASPDTGALPLEVVTDDNLYESLRTLLDANAIKAATFLSWAQRTGAAPKGAAVKLTDIPPKEVTAIIKGFDSLIPILSKRSRNGEGGE